jgi:hypothetical protein
MEMTSPPMARHEGDESIGAEAELKAIRRGPFVITPPHSGLYVESVLAQQIVVTNDSTPSHIQAILKHCAEQRVANPPRDPLAETVTSRSDACAPRRPFWVAGDETTL